MSPKVTEDLQFFLSLHSYTRVEQRLYNIYLYFINHFLYKAFLVFH